MPLETSDLAIVIMAAGKGTRLKSKRPKVLHEIGGRSLLLHVIAAAKSLTSPPTASTASSATRPIMVRHAVAHTGVHFILQADQRGTGHALQIGQGPLRRYRRCSSRKTSSSSPAMLPLIRPETLQVPRHLPRRAARLQ